MIGEHIAIMVLIFVVLYQACCLHTQAKNNDARERDLLNRLMARNYETFVQGEVALKEGAAPLTPEEIYDLQERGVPV